MDKLKKAEKIRKSLETKLINNKYFVGIEIAALLVDGVYTDEPCVRVLVNEKDISHDDLGIKKIENKIFIQVEYRKITLH